jgi:hypothetical protein
MPVSGTSSSRLHDEGGISDRFPATAPGEELGHFPYGANNNKVVQQPQVLS